MLLLTAVKQYVLYSIDDCCAISKKVPGTGEVARFPAETLEAHKDVLSCWVLELSGEFIVLTAHAMRQCPEPDCTCYVNLRARAVTVWQMHCNLT
jgi:hypothetical protein